MSWMMWGGVGVIGGQLLLGLLERIEGLDEV